MRLPFCEDTISVPTGQSSDAENRQPVETMRVGDEANLVSMEISDPYAFETFVEPALIRSSLLGNADPTWYLNVVIWLRVRIPTRVCFILAYLKPM